MTIPKKTLEETSLVLYNVVSNKDIKLEYGATQRRRIKDALERGEKVSGYRVAWLRHCRNEVLDTLIKESERFNRTYKHDHISVNDLVDVLATLMVEFQKAAKEEP